MGRFYIYFLMQQVNYLSLGKIRSNDFAIHNDCNQNKSSKNTHQDKSNRRKHNMIVQDHVGVGAFVKHLLKNI